MPTVIAWLRKYWYVLLIGAALFAVAAIAYRKHTDLAKLLDETNKIHKKEIDDLVAQHAKNIAERDAALERYQNSMVAIEAQYEEAIKELEQRKQQTVIKIIKETNGEPDRLAHKLAESTGFKIIIPKE